LEWELVYVYAQDSANAQLADQVMDSIVVGPFSVGKNTFEFRTKAPKLSEIPAEEIMGVSLLLLSCIYQGQELFQVGYYVYIYEEGQETVPEVAIVDGVEVHDPHRIPKTPKDFNKLMRHILHTKPRLTRFPPKAEDVCSAVAMEM